MSGCIFKYANKSIKPIISVPTLIKKAYQIRISSLLSDFANYSNYLSSENKQVTLKAQAKKTASENVLFFSCLLHILTNIID